MEASLIDTVAKYFYFLSLDEQITFAASFRVMGDLKANGWMDFQNRSRWVQTLTKYREKMQKLPRKDWSHSPNEKGFVLPRGFDMNAWTNFLNNGDIQEVEAVVLSRILDLSDEELAEGLGVSVGTIRYRVGRGLRHLGGFIES